ncbi:MAG: BatA domain-containing protein [Planctomycetales bacterium]
MFGLNLIHAGFLAAGLAVALPILIHLLFRQKSRTLTIGSVRFLQQVVHEHRRRRRLRQWLLLALRMLAVLLLAGLFARPYWDQAVARALEQELVLLIDRSASMQGRGQGASSFERGRSRAGEALARLDENVVVHVAVCDATGVVELPADQLSRQEPSAAATDFGLAVTWAADVLAASNRGTKRIVLFSDLQRSGLPRTPIPSLPGNVELVVEDVGQGTARNVAVEAVAPVRSEIRPDESFRLRVLLKNHGPQTARKVPVRCSLEGPAGSLSATGQADIVGYGRTQLDLPIAVAADGVYRGEATIDFEDSLALDNRRYVGFEARHPDRVLLVDGQEGRSVFANETYYLETALRLVTAESGGDQRSFEVERIVWEAGRGFPRLEGYRCVVLANLRRMAAEDGRRLQSYVQGGGRLLIFAGDQVSAASLSPLADLGVLPGRVAAEPVDGRFRVDAWDAEHPALACFADPQQGDLRRVEFRRLLPLESLVEGARPLVQTGDHVVAAELVAGTGRCLYFGTTADRDWTELPRTRLYVPLIRQLLAHLTDQLGERRGVTSRLVTRPGDKIGIEQVEGVWVVTNLDPRESIPDRVTAEELHASLGVAPPVAEDEERQAALAMTLPPDALRSDEIWTTVAWILLAVLAVETLLAARVHA